MNEQQQRTLIAGLHALGATTRHAAAGRHVEAAVLAELARVSRHREVGAQPAHGGGAGLLAIAAALLLACASGIWVAERAAGRADGATMQMGGFLAIPSAAYLPPMESGAIVRVELPLGALPSYGVQIGPDMGTDHVDADLLVAQDGIPRAIRIVNNSLTTRSTP